MLNEKHCFESNDLLCNIGDIVEVTAKRDIEYSDFVIPKDTSVK